MPPAGAAVAAVVLLLAAALSGGEPVETRPRLIVLTDIGGDPDDQQSMIRLMVHANEFEIEGLIASASGVPGELKQAITRPDLIREIVEAYGQVQPSLARHAPGFPPAADLLARIHSGNPQRGWDHIGAGHDSEASRWIIEVVDRPDPRPVNITIWGGQTDLAQALWRVRADRGQAGYAEFARRLRIYDIGDQDRLAPRLWQEFPGLFYILGQAAAGRDKREAVYRGMYLGGDLDLTSRAWVDANVRLGHGPLGALFPTKTWTAPNPHSTLKEGDTPSWFHFLPVGLGDPGHPGWGGWGGRCTQDAAGIWCDAADTVDGITEARAGVWRWRPAFQNEFAARMDWCVRTPADANHPPTAVVDGDVSAGVLIREVEPGGTLRLDASASTHPDGHTLAFRWWVYREAGTCAAEASISGADSARAELTMPAAAARGAELHVVLEVTDSGTPPLTRYRRVVVRAR